MFDKGLGYTVPKNGPTVLMVIFIPSHCVLHLYPFSDIKCSPGFTEALCQLAEDDDDPGSSRGIQRKS